MQLMKHKYNYLFKYNNQGNILEIKVHTNILSSYYIQIYLHM